MCICPKIGDNIDKVDQDNSHGGESRAGCNRVTHATLHWTVEHNRIDATRVLLDRGAVRNTSCHIGTPLELALYHDDRKIWDMLFPTGDSEIDLYALNFAMTQAITRRELKDHGKRALVELWEVTADLISGLTDQPLGTA